MNHEIPEIPDTADELLAKIDQKSSNQEEPAEKTEDIDPYLTNALEQAGSYLNKRGIEVPAEEVEKIVRFAWAEGRQSVHFPRESRN